MHTLAHLSSLGPDWMDPEYLLERFGQQLLWASLVIVFVECGLFFPILPGDSLLFAIGLFIANGALDVPFGLAVALLLTAAFLGNVVGYEIGRAIGPAIYSRESRFVKKKYFDQTTAFFDKHGPRALVIGRFVPIVRTFVTVVAGVGRMDRGRFYLWSFVGAVLWVVGIMTLGYYLGQVEVIKENIEVAALLIVLVSVTPMVWEYLKHRREANAVVAEVVEEIASPTPGND